MSIALEAVSGTAYLVKAATIRTKPVPANNTVRCK